MAGNTSQWVLQTFSFTHVITEDFGRVFHSLSNDHTFSPWADVKRIKESYQDELTAEYPVS